MTRSPPGLAAARAVQGDSSALTREQVDAALPEMEKYVTQVMEDTGVPGIAIAVVFQDEVVYLRGFGVRETGKDAPVDGDTVFQLASLSKPIASTVVAALVGEGVVDRDDKIVDLYPGFRLYDPWATREVTIRDLFAHRSGLPDHAGDLLEDLGFDLTQVLHRLRYLPPASSMRSTYAYTNFGVTLAAEAAATAAGDSWEQLSEEKLYKPLAMNSTSSRYADFLAEENRALGHVLVDGRWAAKYAREPGCSVAGWRRQFLDARYGAVGTASAWQRQRRRQADRRQQSACGNPSSSSDLRRPTRSCIRPSLVLRARLERWLP